MKVKSESEVAQSCPTLAIPRTAAYQAPPSMGFSRQEYWSGLPLPSPSLAVNNQTEVLAQGYLQDQNLHCYHFILTKISGPQLVLNMEVIPDF